MMSLLNFEVNTFLKYGHFVRYLQWYNMTSWMLTPTGDSPCSVLMCALISMHIGPWSRWIRLKIRFIDDTCVQRSVIVRHGTHPGSLTHMTVLLSLTLGTLEALHIRAAASRFLISQAKIVGFSLLHWMMVEMTPGVRSRGRLPPMVFGSRSPVRR